MGDKIVPYTVDAVKEALPHTLSKSDFRRTY